MISLNEITTLTKEFRIGEVTEDNMKIEHYSRSKVKIIRGPICTENRKYLQEYSLRNEESERRRMIRRRRRRVLLRHR